MARDKVKRKRTLPMPGPITKMLLFYRHQRYANRLPDPDAYLFLDKKGDVITLLCLTDICQAIVRYVLYRQRELKFI